LVAPDEVLGCRQKFSRDPPSAGESYEQNRFRKPEEQKTELPSVAELGK
jgi:hypothetical protein